jgi:segregation and condensation protein A
VAREPFSISEKIALLRGRTLGGQPVPFMALLSTRTRAEVVATFLAVLELYRLGEIEARQEGRFGEILIGPRRGVGQ